VGLFWYDLLPGKLPELPWRGAAYPFILMVIGETFVGVGPQFMGTFHVGTAVIAALVGVVIDWLITYFRHPQAIAVPELRQMPAGS